MAYIGPAPNPGQNREVDDISSGFNGGTASFTLQVNGQNVSPGSANAIIVSLGGVVQNPGTDYTIAASTITFTTNPASGLSFFGLILGQQIDTEGTADGSIVNASVSNSAAIAGTKIAPDFGSQNVVSTGTSNALGTTTIKGASNAAARLLLQNTTAVRTNFIGLSGDDDRIVIAADEANQGSNSSIEFKIDGSERMRIDSSNVGIGTTSPASTLHTSSSSDHIVTHQTTTSGADIRINFRNDGGTDAGGIHYLLNGNALKFITNGAENARFLRSGSHGHMLINTTSQVSNAMLSLTGNGTCVIGSKVTADNNQDHISFRNPNGEVGTVSTNGSSTSFNTSSDYRLKENVVGISDGITRLKTLKPSRFNFKVDKDTTVDGFLAHEVTAVPEAITGTKDEVDSDNNPIYQGIDQSKLVPLLTAALQEAITKIETLETKVAALEAA